MKSLSIATAMLGAGFLNLCGDNRPPDPARGDLRPTETVDRTKRAVFYQGGLEWQAVPEPSQMNWDQARTRCRQRGPGWRLPTGIELRNLLIAVRGNKVELLADAIKPRGLDNGIYWATSPTNADGPAVWLSFEKELKTGEGDSGGGDGEAGADVPEPQSEPVMDQLSVRCVRPGEKMEEAK